MERYLVVGRDIKLPTPSITQTGPDLSPITSTIQALSPKNDEKKESNSPPPRPRPSKREYYYHYHLVSGSRDGTIRHWRLTCDDADADADADADHSHDPHGHDEPPAIWSWSATVLRVFHNWSEPSPTSFFDSAAHALIPVTSCCAVPDSASYQLVLSQGAKPTEKELFFATGDRNGRLRVWTSSICPDPDGKLALDLDVDTTTQSKTDYGHDHDQEHDEEHGRGRGRDLDRMCQTVWIFPAGQTLVGLSALQVS